MLWNSLGRISNREIKGEESEWKAKGLYQKRMGEGRKEGISLEPKATRKPHTGWVLNRICGIAVRTPLELQGGSLPWHRCWMPGNICEMVRVERVETTPLLRGWAMKGRRTWWAVDGGGGGGYCTVEKSWECWWVRDREAKLQLQEELWYPCFRDQTGYLPKATQLIKDSWSLHPVWDTKKSIFVFFLWGLSPLFRNGRASSRWGTRGNSEGWVLQI